MLLWSAVVVLMATGDRNGIGWFQQPQTDLWFPMISGVLWRALTSLAASYATLVTLRQRSAVAC